MGIISKMTNDLMGEILLGKQQFRDVGISWTRKDEETKNPIFDKLIIILQYIRGVFGSIYSCHMCGIFFQFSSPSSINRCCIFM